ncbi:Zinc finger BED domain-containing protein 4 [Neolecta irregularis DAH-3]|uniref:Zinc finger BED domain-containing protein 4 n=1 Tax=Neolecta irregularis (strain DAH-3) TaxID=1198029 RepID=A0A1U7LL64_NEOID|nr:Zinc finger BED domain-containing protein 4 [Neolecta irregularis DAH-3]|eukprot:OLL23282.1 Zinc finger BED domain-containing protein 4 [Neolecta irregularis DAH-3]
MISWALKPEIMQAIKDTIDEEPDLANDFLSTMNWKMLSSICEFLEPFLHTTKACESSDHCINRVIPALEYLLQHFENYRVKWAGDVILINCIEAGWNKLNEYYTKTDDSPAYAAAVVLDPRWKWAYFERRWKDRPEWIIHSKEQVRQFWNTNYEVSTTTPAITQAILQQQQSGPSTNQFNLWMDSQMDDLTTSEESEYDVYCSEALLRTNAVPPGHQGPLLWWLDQAQRRRFPSLSTMAIDILSAPAMEASTERLFSSAQRDFTDRRNRLLAATGEMLQCIKSWDNCPIINGKQPDIPIAMHVQPLQNQRDIRDFPQHPSYTPLSSLGPDDSLSAI